ncbi:hypothetical protein MLD38_004018 [Melastoma candidum]|nr:hypothetical protein MLD38_004018 [Melastoma candidum]
MMAAPSSSATTPADETETVNPDTELSEGNADVATLKRKREEDTPSDDAPVPASSVNPLWKTSLCSFFRRTNGLCSHGSECKFAHGEEELRPRPDNTWDPTSERAKREKADNEDREREKEDKGVLMMTEMVDEEEGDAGLSKCLVHLPQKWGSDQLRNFLNDQGTVYKSAKKKKGMMVGFVTFGDREQLETGVKGLDGKSIGNKNIKIADVIPRPFEKKGRQENIVLPKVQQDGEQSGDEDKGSNAGIRSVRDVVTPLAHLSYAEQLEEKKKSLLHMLKKLTRSARKACPSGVVLPDWILKSRERGGLPCNLEGILESPLIDGYRNKCEFSVGYSLNGQPTVGFMLGNYREGVTAVEEPNNCPNVSTIASKYAALFQRFLQCSELPLWNRFNNTGFWRQLTVREGRRSAEMADSHHTENNIGEVMLIIQVCSAGHEDSVVNGEFERLAKALVTGAAESSPCLPLTCLVVQDHQGISNVAPADAPLRSLPITLSNNPPPPLEASANDDKTRIHDYIGNHKFSISPTAFFQVNTLAAEKLYSLAGDWADLDSDTLLFDVCCGTGTIGITLAHRVGMVIGIEMNASAVLDAQRNAEINGIANCKFVCGKAEDVMGSLLKDYLQSLPQNTAFVSTKCEEEVDNIDSCEKEKTGIDEKQDTENGSNNLAGESQHKSSLPEIEDHKMEDQPQNTCISNKERTSPLQFKKVVAIVDPPRAGLHPTVIKTLRAHSHLRKLVYISCNPESLVANAIELCSPSPENGEKGKKDNRGWRNMSSAGLARHRVKSMPKSEPFRPVKAMAVDLFPHTPHCELVMLLER